MENVYENCLAHELALRGIAFRRQQPLPVVYKEVKLEDGHRMDFVVENSVVVEVKSVEFLHAVHQAQVITYLRLSGLQVGLLINFNVLVLKDGVKRMVLTSMTPISNR